MQEQLIDQGKPLRAEKFIRSNLATPVREDQQLTCAQCRFCDQDVDAWPCTKCHTRH